MASPLLAKRTIFVLPAVLLVISLLQDLVAAYAQMHMRNVAVRVAVLLFLKGVAFAVAGELVTPWLQVILTTTRRGSARHAGLMGLLLFYGAAYGGLYYLYLAAERRGVASLLPNSLRGLGT
jgi:hypothetical protein